MLAQSSIPATETQDSRKGSVSPAEVGRSRKEDKSKRKRKFSPTRGYAPESPSSSRNDAPGTRPWKRKRTGEDVQNEDKENSYGVEQRKATKNGPTKVPKPAIEIQQTPVQTPKQKPIKTPTQTPNSTKTSRPHSSTKKQTLTGFFTAAEVQQLEHFKLDFCNTNGLSGDTFDEMVQHSERDKSREFPCDASIISKSEFWRNIYESMPQRDRRSVYRFMRRHFQASTQKPHEWTREQDDELVSLHSQHGPKWAYIAKLIGRSDDDVVQRWKNRLEHRNTMLRGPWSAEEIRELQNALNRSWKAMRDSGVEVGRDIYEMEETLVGWGHVSERMQHRRSRQQCADKWRRIRRRILDLRERGNPDATYEPTIEMKSPKKPRTPVTVAQEVPKEKRYKSSEYVEDEDEEPEHPVESDPTGVKPESESEPQSRPAEESESDSDTGGPNPEQTKPAVTQSPSRKRSTGDSSDSDSGSESGEPAPRNRPRSAGSAEIQKSPISGSGSESESGSGDEAESEDEESKPNEENADGDRRMSLDAIRPADGDETTADESESERDKDGDVDMDKTALNTVENGVQNQESGTESESKSTSKPTGREPEVQSTHIQKSASESSDSESESNSGSEAEPATVQKPAEQSDSGSESESESESDAEPESATAQKPAEQSDSDSESESESGSEAKPESATAQKPAKQSESESESEPESEAKVVPQKPQQASSGSEDTSDSDSGSGSGSSDSASSRSRSQSLDNRSSRAPPRTLPKASSKASPRESPKKATPESDSESTSSGSDPTSSGSETDSESDSESESEDESDRIKQESRSGSENTFRFIKAEDVDSD